MATFPFHYGWVILVTSALGAFMTTPGQTVAVSTLFDPITTDLRLPRGASATACAVGTLLGILPAPLAGRWI